MASTINVKIAPLPRGDYSSSATYAKLDVVSYNGSSYMAIKAVPTGTAPTNTTYWQLLAEKPTIGEGSITTDMLADGAVTADKLDSSVSDKYAEVSGTYENMVVGSAEQLLSIQYDTDSVPYAFRKSPYGDREVDEIVGGTIAWNQLKQTGANYMSASAGKKTYDSTDDSYTVTLTASSSYMGLWSNPFKAIIGHKYFVTAKVKASTPRSIVFGVEGATTSVPNIPSEWTTISTVSSNSNASKAMVFYFNVNSLSEFVADFKEIQFFDLTQMFGSAIADHIYSLEQANAGAGVAWFKSFFNKPYYAYNTGELISVSGLSAHKMTGFNQWDEDTLMPLAGFTKQTDGSWYSSNSALVTVGTVIWENKSGYTGRFYISCDYKYSSSTSSGARFKIRFKDGTQQQFAMSPSTTYAHFEVQSYSDRVVESINYDYGSGGIQTWMKNVCVNFAWDGERNGEYEPYESHSYALDSSLTLRGVPKLNSANGMYFDGDVYKSDGSVTRRYGIVDLGSIDWVKSTHNTFSSSAISSLIRPTPTIYDVPTWLVNAKYGCDSSSNVYGGDAQYDKCITVNSSGTVIVNDSAYSSGDATAFKTAMNGVMLVYELATPTTESAEPYQNPQICNEYGTEEYVSAEQSGVTMIVGHNTKYPQNLRKKIEGLPWNFSSLIAPTEVTNKATRNYTVGSFLIMNNTLYKVTSAIANGGTITVGSNVTATTIMQEILAL